MNRMLLFILAALFCFAFSAPVFAQPAADGDMVELNVDKLWKVSWLPNAPIADREMIGEGYAYPSISPDGSRVMLFKRGLDGAPNTLLQWSESKAKPEMVLEDSEASMFVSWPDDSHFVMRERSNPFFRSAAKRHYSLERASAKLRERRLIAESRYLAYDAGDVIVLENKENHTLQAISDVRADRYSGPILSPDERFVAFEGLTTGIQLFDIQANAVVFIGGRGSYPRFTPDGRFLVYASTADDGHQYTHGDIVVLDLNSHAIRYISNPDGEIRLNGTLSRDGAFAAWQTVDGRIIRARLASDE